MKTTLSRLCAFVLSALVLTLSAVAAPVTPELKKDVVDRMVAAINRRAFAAGVDFDKLGDHFQKHQKGIDAANDDRAFAAEVNKTLREFGISHIRLLTPQAATNRVRTDQVGIGVTTRKMDDGLVVADVVQGSPAESAGLRQGDIILKIDGSDAANAEPLGGTEGSPVVLTLRRADGRTVEDMTVTRGKFSTRRPETLTLIDDDAAVLRVSTFSTGFDRRNLNQLFERLAQADRSILVVDLRGNGGGAVNNLNFLLSYFLPKGTPIGTNVSKATAQRYKESGKGDTTNAIAIAKSMEPNQRVQSEQANRFTGKVAVLIDRGSASASEIFSSCLRESRGTLLVGTPSAGAVLVSVHENLTGGWQVQIPISDFVTVKGVRLEGYKIKPDIEVKAARKSNPNDDEAVLRAIDRLRKTVSNTAAPTALEAEPAAAK